MESAARPLALTLGDPAGIGPDITLLAFQARLSTAIPSFMLLGDPVVLAERARNPGSH
jgi:4-hydroxythreonine-4-phosphate dehydrogenase